MLGATSVLFKDGSKPDPDHGSSRLKSNVSVKSCANSSRDGAGKIENSSCGYSNVGISVSASGGRSWVIGSWVY